MTNDAGSRDFRGKRYKLPPEAFAIAPTHEPPPSDLIDKETWLSVVHLPDDVSLRTSDHHGTLVRRAYETWGMWVSLQLDVQATFEPPDRFSEDVLQVSCLNVTDELHASLYFMLTGFYRQAISVLRSALDGVVAGAFFRAYPDRVRATRWLNSAIPVARDDGLIAPLGRPQRPGFCPQAPKARSKALRQEKEVVAKVPVARSVTQSHREFR